VCGASHAWRSTPLPLDTLATHRGGLITPGARLRTPPIVLQPLRFVPTARVHADTLHNAPYLCLCAHTASVRVYLSGACAATASEA